MKIKRSWLLAITAGMGVLMIVYTLLRQFAGFSLGEKIEKNFYDGIIIVALALFLYNRKLASDEVKEAAAKAEAEKRALEGAQEDAEDVDRGSDEK